MDLRETTDTIVIHCSQTPPDMDIGVDKITEWHKERGFDTIGYHFVIRRDGTIETGRNQEAVGAHAVAVNGTSLGVCLIGGADRNMKWEDNFAPIQFQTLKTLLMKLKKDYIIKKIIGHYEVDDKKECPSFDIPKWLEKTNLVGDKKECLSFNIPKWLKKTNL